jgi:uncharacterized membrane protein
MVPSSLHFYDIVVFLHVIGVILAFGVIFTYPLIVPYARRQQLRALPHIHRIQSRIGQFVITPGATLVLLAGLYLALSGDGRFDLADWWVGFGLVVILLILGLGGAYFAPTERRLAELAERDVGASSGSVVMSEDYDRAVRGWQALVNLMCVLVTATVLLMVLGARGVFS